MILVDFAIKKGPEGKVWKEISIKSANTDKVSL
jgi:hypothetical protein